MLLFQSFGCCWDEDGSEDDGGGSEDDDGFDFKGEHGVEVCIIGVGIVVVGNNGAV